PPDGRPYPSPLSVASHACGFLVGRHQRVDVISPVGRLIETVPVSVDGPEAPWPSLQVVSLVADAPDRGTVLLLGPDGLGGGDMRHALLEIDRDAPARLLGIFAGPGLSCGRSLQLVAGGPLPAVAPAFLWSAGCG